MATTKINYNGSKWAGEEPDTLDVLCERLAQYRLKADFAPFANVVDGHTGTVRYFGNFDDYSHAFSIETDDPEVIAQLGRAIRANRRRNNIRGVTALWDFTAEES